MKAELGRQIRAIIKHRRLTQTQAGQVLGISQPKVSDLMRGQLASISTDCLFRFLKTLDRDVEIVIKPTPRNRAHGRVRVVLSRTQVHNNDLWLANR